MAKQFKCSKCKSGDMKPGFRPDLTQLGYFREMWLGDEQSNISENDKVIKMMWTFKSITNITMVVKTYRCESCGYLESYA